MKNLNSLLNILLFFVVGISAGIFYIGFKKEKVSQKQESSFEQSSLSPSKESTDEVVNHFLKEMDRKKRLEEFKTFKDVRNNEDLKKLNQELTKENMDFSHIPLEEQISPAYKQETPKFQIPGGINSSNAREFVEAARQNGYEVILSENYEVISVRPINKRNVNDVHEVYPAE